MMTVDDIATVEIDFADQRKGAVTKLDLDWHTLYLLATKAEVPEGTKIKLRIRNGSGPYGFTQRTSDGYRVVLNIRYEKPQLSESAAYVVNNTLLHELRHVAQGELSGWHSLDSDYNGWSETEAREYGRTIKGQSEFFALR